jgi:hypothetical protein
VTRTIHQLPAFIALASVLLTGCGNGGNGGNGDTGDYNGNGGSAARVSASEIGRGLERGQFALDISGFVVSTGDYEGDVPAARFQPWNYGSSRERADGYGGREEVEVWNATGPYRIWLLTEVSRDGGETEDASAWVQFPPDAQAGRTYPIRSTRMARHGEAYGGLQRHDMVWRDGTHALEGEVTIVELGDYLTATFHFDNGHEDEQHTRVEARVYRVPFMPRGEAFYTFTRDGETTEFAGRVIRQSQDHRFELMSDHISFSFGPRPEPGTYTLERRRDDARQVVGLSADGARFDSVDGTVEVSENDGYYTMNFTFTTQGQDEVSAEGRFEWIAVP